MRLLMYLSLMDGTMDWAPNLISVQQDHSEKRLCWYFEHSTVRLTSPERDLQTALMESRSLRDDVYGSLFQQSGSVETRGECSAAGDNAANTESLTSIMLRLRKTPMRAAASAK